MEALKCKHCGKTVQQAVPEEDPGPLWSEVDPIGSTETTPSSVGADAAPFLSSDVPASESPVSPPPIVSATETPATSPARDASPIVAPDQPAVEASPVVAPAPSAPQPAAPPPLTTPEPSTSPPASGTPVPPSTAPAAGSGNEPIANPQKIDPVLAAILSGCCICGLGQMLIGQVEKGILLLVCAFVVGFVTFGLGSLLIFPIAAVDAYLSASKVKRGEVLRKWDWF